MRRLNQQSPIDPLYEIKVLFYTTLALDYLNKEGVTLLCYRKLT